MSAATLDKLLLVGDVRTQLQTLPDASVDTCITSPPYFWLRDYGASDQIGMEGHVDLWVDELLLVFRGLARVLKEQGSVWLNVADSYSRHPRFGAPAKSLLLAPERLALALAGDGWIVRNRVAWTKPNPMPNSVADRLNTTWEFRLLPHPLPSVLLRSRCHPRASSFCAPRR
jgi:DNA modification methylase